jgi:hypothetical protein
MLLITFYNLKKSNLLVTQQEINTFERTKYIQ